MNRSRLLTLITALSMTFPPLLPAASADTPVDRRQLEHLLLQDCGSCHGLRLTGGLGPAITSEALAGKPRESLIATTSPFKDASIEHRLSLSLRKVVG